MKQDTNIVKIDENRQYRAPVNKDPFRRKIKTLEEILETEAADKERQRRYAKARRQKQQASTGEQR
jgi:hypothetical protein